jgi:hypothetical protein
MSSQTALGALGGDLRMVDGGGGVVAASTTDVTLHVPYAMGLVCGVSGGQLVATLFPVDSVAWATATPHGYAVGDGGGDYAYVPLSARAIGAWAGVCAGAQLTTLTGGRIVALSPAPSPAPDAASPIFLYQDIHYQIGPSVTVPGRSALWRSTVGHGVREELAAPLDNQAAIRFHVLSSDTSLVTPPADLSTIVGLEFILDGFNAAGSVTPEIARYRASLFFTN